MKALTLSLALVSSPALAGYAWEETVETHKFALEDATTASAHCMRLCDQWFEARKNTTGSYRCAFDTEDRAFGRGDFRKAAVSCRLIHSRTR